MAERCGGEKSVVPTIDGPVTDLGFGVESRKRPGVRAPPIELASGGYPRTSCLNMYSGSGCAIAPGRSIAPIFAVRLLFDMGSNNPPRGDFVRLFGMRVGLADSPKQKKLGLPFLTPYFHRAITVGNSRVSAVRMDQCTSNNRREKMVSPWIDYRLSRPRGNDERLTGL